MCVLKMVGNGGNCNLVELRYVIGENVEADVKDLGWRLFFLGVCSQSFRFELNKPLLLQSLEGNHRQLGRNMRKYESVRS